MLCITRESGLYEKPRSASEVFPVWSSERQPGLQQRRAGESQQVEDIIFNEIFDIFSPGPKRKMERGGGGREREGERKRMKGGYFLQIELLDAVYVCVCV